MIVGLALHWPCIADNSGYPLMDSLEYHSPLFLKNVRDTGLYSLPADAGQPRKWLLGGSLCQFRGFARVWGQIWVFLIYLDF